MITIHQRHRRSDRQTTCDRNTALCTNVHRAVKTVTMTARRREIADMNQPPQPPVVKARTDTRCKTNHTTLRVALLFLAKLTSSQVK